MAKHSLKILRCVNTARFLKYVWPFYNIIHKRVKWIRIKTKCWTSDQMEQSIQERTKQNLWKTIFKKTWRGMVGFKQTIYLQIFQRLFSTNFTWSILEYFVPNIPLLTHLGALFLYYTPWKSQKTKGTYTYDIFRGHRNSTLVWNGLNCIKYE